MKNASTFVTLIDRGGLSKPSENTLSITVLCYQLFTLIIEEKELKILFLSAKSHVHVFLSLVLNYIMDKPVITECEEKHDISKGIICSMFNAISKNLVKEHSSIAQNKRVDKKKEKFNK